MLEVAGLGVTAKPELVEGMPGEPVNTEKSLHDNAPSVVWAGLGPTLMASDPGQLGWASPWRVETGISDGIFCIPELITRRYPLNSPRPSDPHFFSGSVAAGPAVIKRLDAGLWNLQPVWLDG